MRTLVIGALAGLLALAGPARAARADVAAELRLGAQALAERKLAEADAAFRRAFDAAEATADERSQALNGLLGSAVERGTAAELAAYVEQRRAAAPDDQKSALLLAVVRCRKASDGHFRGIIPLLEREAGPKAAGYAAQRLLRDVNALPPSFQRGAERLARDLTAGAVLQPRQVAKPRYSAKGGKLRGPELSAPTRPDYEARAARVATPPRPRLRGVVEPIRLRPPVVPRLQGAAPVSLVKPPAPPRPHASRLAVAFFGAAYQKATELAGQGFVDSAKAEYAMLIQLFPGTPQAQQAARYALTLFRRERGAAQVADALASYLQWLRAILGPEGDDYAEHLAFKSLADDADPMIVVREAEAFLKRHPDSKYGPAIRLRLAVALDTVGSSARAIEVLKPLASPLDEAVRVKAAHMLAWLYIFQGDAAPARQTLEALAAQSVAPATATAAGRLLQEMAAHPLPKLPVAEVVGGDTPDEVLAARILETAEALLRKGDPERAMDLYALYLRVAKESPGYFLARTRIERLKQTGRADEE